MSKINSIHLAFLARRCTYIFGSLEWADWISDELERIRNIEAQVLELRTFIDNWNSRHKKEVGDLKAKIVELQKLCLHESVEHTPRGTAEGISLDVCRICGKVL